MNDQQASACLWALLELAVAIRDDGPTQVRAAAQRVLDAAGGDPAAALAVAAALIRVDEPIETWWQRGLAGVGAKQAVVLDLEPCGTHAAYNRHIANGEDPCDACQRGEAIYSSRGSRRRRNAAGAA